MAKTFASCFKNGGKNIAQNYPYWDDKTQKVRTAEMDLMDCAKNNGAEPSFLKADLSKDLKARVELAGAHRPLLFAFQGPAHQH